VAAVVGRARELGLERVTVHSSPRAIPAYACRGFASSPRLLHTMSPARSRPRPRDPCRAGTRAAEGESGGRGTASVWGVEAS
jgi:hypothetical protein